MLIDIVIIVVVVVIISNDIILGLLAGVTNLVANTGARMCCC